MAIRKSPRGFATAGLILGIVGLLELAFVAYVVYSSAQVVGSLQTIVNESLNQSLVRESAREVAEEWKLNEQLPTKAEGQELVAGKTDVFNNEIRYDTDGSSFTIRAAGEDQEFDTADDVTIGPFFDAQDAIDQCEQEDEPFEFEIEDEDEDGA